MHIYQLWLVNILKLVASKKWLTVISETYCHTIDNVKKVRVFFSFQIQCFLQLHDHVNWESPLTPHFYSCNTCTFLYTSIYHSLNIYIDWCWNQCCNHTLSAQWFWCRWQCRHDSITHLIWVIPFPSIILWIRQLWRRNMS